MILFCDTSALMKAYANEINSPEVRAWLDAAAGRFVSLLAWTEMCAAFGLKERTLQITHDESAAGLRRFKSEWGGFTNVQIDRELVQQAGELALSFGLRAYDSVHLASVQRVQRQLGSNLAFCCFDKQLDAAAQALGIKVINT